MRKMNMGGSVPRQTTIQGQRHDLAYINPFEVDLLESYNATPGGVAGPGGVPAYPPGPGYGQSGYSAGGGYSSDGSNNNNNNNGGGGFEGVDPGLAAAAAQANANAQAAQAQEAAANAQAQSQGFSNANAQAQAQAKSNAQTPGGYYGADFGEKGRTGTNANPGNFGFNEGPQQDPNDNTKSIENMNNAEKSKAVVELQKSIKQTEDEIAKKTGLAKVYAQVTNKAKLDQQKNAIDNMLGKYKATPFQSALQKAGLAGTPVSFTAVKDKNGNYVGSAGLDAGGNVVSFSGDTNANFADPDVQGHVDGMNAAGDLSGNPETNPNIGGPDLPPIDMDPCPEGFTLDAATNVCVPVTPVDIDNPDGDDDSDDPLPPYVPPSEVVGLPDYTPIGGLGSFVPTPLQPYQSYQIQPQPMITMVLGEEQG